eukprot:9483707-Pyramimonas_sp.AAC.1
MRCTSKLYDGGDDDGDGDGGGVDEDAEKKPSHVTLSRLGSSRDYCCCWEHPGRFGGLSGSP